MRYLVTTLLSLGLLGCGASASDDELRQMCEHLEELRNSADVETNIEKCVADAKREKISKQQALCRISAVNKSEYWNRCRTGKAKAPKKR